MFTTEREGEKETIAKQDGKRGYCNIFATRESPHARERDKLIYTNIHTANPIFLITITSSA